MSLCFYPSGYQTYFPTREEEKIRIGNEGSYLVTNYHPSYLSATNKMCSQYHIMCHVKVDDLLNL